VEREWEKKVLGKREFYEHKKDPKDYGWRQGFGIKLEFIEGS